MLTNLHLNFKDHIYDACCRVGKAKTLLEAHSERNNIVLEEIVMKTVGLSTCSYSNSYHTKFCNFRDVPIPEFLNSNSKLDSEIKYWIRNSRDDSHY